jgi:hypothetical protein
MDILQQSATGYRNNSSSGFNDHIDWADLNTGWLQIKTLAFGAQLRINLKDPFAALIADSNLL